ncbi:hypothetical protein [Ornithinimicrobium panacihumi]|uniref:hypothetical protein n=1 Tax=Ornithinimicrobium panacihumi TaxID=2008449 RepID=UPI003F8AB1C7
MGTILAEPDTIDVSDDDAAAKPTWKRPDLPQVALLCSAPTAGVDRDRLGGVDVQSSLHLDTLVEMQRS